MVKPQLLGGYQVRYLTWVCDSGLPLTKQFFDAGDGV